MLQGFLSAPPACVPACALSFCTPVLFASSWALSSVYCFLHTNTPASLVMEKPPFTFLVTNSRKSL